jgi:two-component system sensor histidine kinase KdpD
VNARDDERPDPDARPALVRAMEARERRGRLKIFFGAAPGVGKTFAMLEAARRAEAEGIDLVLGVVETHGRPDTAALVGGRRALPRRTVEHRGVTFDELDLDAALARKPAVILVDELAHTNAPGSRHVKRWQDVLELLDVGIDVWTTLDVQHLESLGDVVQQITGVEVREAVPDAVLDRADEIELIDLSPEALLERLANGKVDGPAPASRAVPRLVQRGNLLALRALALRRTAERVDADVLAYRCEHGIAETWPTRERIVVCVGPSPGSERLIRASQRIAQSLRAPWTSVHVDVIGAPPLGDRDRERLEAHLRMTEALGGEVVRLRGRGVAPVLLEYARMRNVTRIVVGKPTHSWLRDRVRGSLLDELIRGSGTMEVHVIAPIESPAPRPAPSGSAVKAGTAAYASAAGAIAAVTLLGIVTYAYFTVAELTMLYLIAIMLASLLGRGPSLLAASLAVGAFDFFFVPPRFTFAVADARQLLTFAVMFGSGLAISTLTVRLRGQERDAISREQRAAALLAFTREVVTAAAVEDVAAMTTKHLEESLDVAAAVLVDDAGQGLVAAAGLMPLAGQELAVARWTFEHRSPAGHGTDTLSAARVLCVPLADGERSVGVIALQQRPGTPPRLGIEQRHLLDAIARQASLALARVMLADQARESALRARTEELRSSLLSAVSHDLRTPLSVITGAATTLRDGEDRLSLPERRDLVATIVDDAQRLERVLANLLQLTRVETGLSPRRECVPADDVVGAALTRLEDSLRGLAVETDVPADVMLEIDPILFEQVMINLIENALKHGAAPLSIRVRRRAEVVEIELADRGPGLPPGAPARLFEKFVRASEAPGVGLGLAVVRAIVEAHGGTVTADNRTGGGACFRITLPTPAAPEAQRPMMQTA